MKNKVLKSNNFFSSKYFRLFFAFVFLVVGFLVFGNIESVSAGDCCYLHPPNGVNSCDQGVASESACNQLCADANSTEQLCLWTEEANTVAGQTLPSEGKDLSTGPGVIGGVVVDAFKWLLYGVFVFVSWLMGIAAILLGWVIKTDNVKLVLDNTAIYESWKMVRDMLNLAFILVLLFSAFCTIFQVEKYHLKKILLTLVIMALLVNFSFPVSRFIIDVSNVAFYFIINSAFPDIKGGEGIFSSIASHAGIVDILKPETSQVKNADVWYLIAIIVFTFILMITFLVIAVMFVIRLVVLGILIIFAPVGFVAAIFPSTKHYADDWWSNLFKYSFFAPIMAFMLAIALNILGAMKSDALTGFLQVAQNNIGGSTVDANTVGKMAFFSIPIVILWAGLITAQKLSIAGAGVVTNQAKKFAGWAGKKFSGYNMAKRQVDAFSAARKKREEEKVKTRVGGRIGSWINQKQDAAMGIISPKAKKRAEKMRTAVNKEGIENKSKDLEGTNAAILAKDIDIAITTPPPTKDDKIEAAGKVKQALSRRNEFEKAIENRIENDISSGKLIPPSPLTPPPTAPTLIAAPVLSVKPEAKEIEDRNDIIRANEKLERQYEKDQEKWKNDNEKREKDFIQQQKTIFIESARKIISDAEKA